MSTYCSILVVDTNTLHKCLLREFLPSPCGRCVLPDCKWDKIQCFGQRDDQTLDGGNFVGDASCSVWGTRVDAIDTLEWSATRE